MLTSEDVGRRGLFPDITTRRCRPLEGSLHCRYFERKTICSNYRILTKVFSKGHVDVFIDLLHDALDQKSRGRPDVIGLSRANMQRKLRL
jgi:hypothetical protein